MIAYLAPTLVALTLYAAAARLRQHIEPACPACRAREWYDTPAAMTCKSCGWTTSPQADAAGARLAA